ncbi:hypothetical protein RHMOL_Rhmol06G0132100 [Rhododendron molle]|nr:hypothetical protein RHMOL_Rhmol06G0132100 [Rhododendron molle]KAI8550752.1 hypothetical protein RHMOL_Rhmol06G0132100 [Rhododendron molle]KAI8550753.1 hypothetical protein RHMOL_Rhmol06G0132100 [Rhododendron molle]KAI8550754.1 hypothetical protein RHMOL_Rhmol06G0132100 [Rhododendron molle]KAI8550755.1 hypothetical protein RHMOL_Rhmol06G0132100 [Rhododendron molle]
MVSPFAIHQHKLLCWSLLMLFTNRKLICCTSSNPFLWLLRLNQMGNMGSTWLVGSSVSFPTVRSHCSCFFHEFSICGLCNMHGGKIFLEASFLIRTLVLVRVWLHGLNKTDLCKKLTSFSCTYLKSPMFLG